MRSLQNRPTARSARCSFYRSARQLTRPTAWPKWPVACLLARVWPGSHPGRRSDRTAVRGLRSSKRPSRATSDPVLSLFSPPFLYARTAAAGEGELRGGGPSFGGRRRRPRDARAPPSAPLSSSPFLFSYPPPRRTRRDDRRRGGAALAPLRSVSGTASTRGGRRGGGVPLPPKGFSLSAVAEARPSTALFFLRRPGLPVRIGSRGTGAASRRRSLPASRGSGPVRSFLLLFSVLTRVGDLLLGMNGICFDLFSFYRKI